MKSTFHLGRDDVEKIRKAQTAALLKRLAQGKTITAAQQEFLDSQSEQPKQSAEPQPSLPIYDSMQQCSAATFIPLSVLKNAKRRGCDAFRANRVYLGLLLRWIFTAEDSGSPLDLYKEQARLTKADAELREIELAQKKSEVVTLDEVATIANPVLLACRQRLNALPTEAGARCNPTDPLFAQQQLQAWVDRTLPLIREALPKAKESQ